MIDSLYIPIIIVQRSVFPNQFPNVIDRMMNFRTPDGVKILSVENEEDWLVEQIILQLKALNHSEADDSGKIYDSPEYLIRVDLEVDEPVRLMELDWFEEQMIDLVSDVFICGGYYFFYLVDDGSRFKARNVVKTIEKGEAVILLDSEGDDISFIQEAAPFLSHYWYKPDDLDLAEKFTPLITKYLLLFEE